MTSLSEVFERAAKAQLSHVAIAEEAGQRTFGELLNEIDRAAALIRERVKGNTVGILLLNSHQFVTTLFAVWKAGKTAVPLNYLLPPADIGFIIRDSGMSALVSSQFFAANLAALKPLFGDKGVILMADDPEFLGATPLESSHVAADRALILYTSGTTGRPKGVLLTHDNLKQNVESCQRAGEFDHRDTFLCLLPFFHTYAITGTILLPLFNGCKMVLVDRFAPLKVLKLIEQHKVSVFLAIPSMYRVMAMTEGDFDLRSVRFPISGGEPLPVAIAQAFEKRFGVPIFEGYGQTEAAPVVTLNVPGANRLGSIGRTIPGVEVVIWDDHHNVLPFDQVGELMVRGGNVMAGYHNLPEDTAKTITNGWLHTGDLGRMDANGYITITGRKKELIISAGENIYPREIEELLARHPKIKECAVIGVRDEVRGEVPKAFVIVHEGQNVDEKEIRSFCREHLANYKVPKYIDLVADLPRTPTGKILKRALTASVQPS